MFITSSKIFDIYSTMDICNETLVLHHIIIQYRLSMLQNPILV